MGPATAPSLFRHPPFVMYLSGTVLSQIGTQGTFVAVLYHMYLLSGSTLQVGLIGLARGTATLVCAPLSGYYADRLDRRRLLQACQVVSMFVSFGLAATAMVGVVQPWHLLVAVFAQSTASIFDSPIRKAIIPAFVPQDQLVKGFAVINPSTQVGKLGGPALAGMLIAAGGPQLMYLVDGATFVVLVVILGLLHVPRLAPDDRASGLFTSFREGSRFMRRQPVLLHLIGLDLSAVLFCSYRVVLPAIVLEVLGAGATAYGVLASGPAVGALVGGAAAYRLAGMGMAVPNGVFALSGTVMMGVSALALAMSTRLAPALLAVGLFGLGDALATVVRHAALLLETPDRLRGRVSALSSMAGQGGPAFGELNVGWMATALGVTGALVVGGMVPVVYAAVVAASVPRVRAYRAGLRPDSTGAVTRVAGA